MLSARIDFLRILASADPRPRKFYERRRAGRRVGCDDDGMSEVRIVDAMATGRDAEAAAMVFEYVAMTWEEAGHPRPGDVDDLPGTLAAECRALPTYYAAPGAILLAVGGVAGDE